ncbi:Abortive infection protein [Parvibaculum lavamentivorans DS-1]|uniref:Abortive infection protein n=1 Tax=Parvibaculum lavamentivorans (strain DS-1 / DSM 13023 / NCIMB 13966) TaxID=402881 RepID=A7HS19_PARL1|nr:CPBP family intramembrane glutamic endopeptidase [Parvibaculum lavamentivorans]ABS62702.1 Abortive infection protein [Parvibaculum lavamentivorans DS-1]
MLDGIDILWAYNMRMAPGLLAFALCLALLPRAAAGLRTALYIAIFILIRDAMTPAGLWSFEGLRISFFNEPMVLATLGVMSVLGVIFLVSVERDMRPLLVWRKGTLIEGGMVGLGAGLAIGIGAASLSGLSPMLWDFTPGFILGLVILAYGGNLLEEVLFRGYLQGRLEQIVTPVRAALLSGLVFAACHSYLAITVTNGGWPILAFTAIEGIACGFVRLRYGIWAATLTHGTAILLISMPMLV